MRLGVRVGRRGKVLSFLLLQLSGELENLLVLLALGLVVNRKLPFGILDVIFRETALVLGSLDVRPDALNFELFLVDDGLGVHDVTVDRCAVLAKVRILALKTLQLSLEILLLGGLLFNLLLVVLAQVADAILEGSFAGLDISDTHFEGFKHGVKVGAIL